MEIVVRQISRRFDSVRDGVHAGHRSILQSTLHHLERMDEERFFEFDFGLNRVFNNCASF
jgi:hypothetical protein